MFYLLTSWILLSLRFSTSWSQSDFANIQRADNDLLWCCVSEEELIKCQEFSEAAERDNLISDITFGSYFRSIKCKQYQNKGECMRVLDINSKYNPNIMTLDAGEVFVGGRYHSLVPILREVYDENKDFHHSVALVKRNTLPNVNTMRDLKGVRACFGTVGSLAGWIIPIYRLMAGDFMDISDCNNHVKSAIDFFGKGCAVDSLLDRYNPLGDNSHNFCELCGSDTPGVRCTTRDPYADYTGALLCLKDKGEVAFVHERVLREELENQDDYELLCPTGDVDGSFVRRPVTSFKECAWGISPGQAVVVSSAMDMKERQGVQSFLNKAVDLYGPGLVPSSPSSDFGRGDPNNGMDASNSNNNGQSSSQSFSNFWNNPSNRDPGEWFGNRNPDRSSDGQNQSSQFGDQTRYGDKDRDPFRQGSRNVAGRQRRQLNRGDDNIFDNPTPRPSSLNNEVNYDQDEDEDAMGHKPFKLFESSPRYGMLRNLLFSDGAKGMKIIKPNDMSYKAFLGQSYGGSLNTPMTSIEGIRKCPVGDMRLCVTSEAELSKCVRMRTALNAQLLEPKMSCKRARTHIECMRQIHEGEADVVMLDAGDVYRGGWHYGLIPIMAEVYNLGTPHYYAVAVTKQRDNSSELIYLKRKNTCHTGVGQAAGWIIPMAWLIGNERIRDYGCDSVRAAAEYFSKACAPGAQSTFFTNRYESNYWQYSHLCDLCHGQAGHYCDRNHMEDYYGYTGAFRCLVEGGGNVAFVKHTTVTENCDGKRKAWWARNQLTTDYELLCRDGTRASARDYKKCFLGKVKANALVTSPRFGQVKVSAFINLFKYAQQFYGQKVHDEFSFSMFYSTPPYADLIFQDATQQLIVLPEKERDYTVYLDQEFLKAYSLVECRSRALTAQISSLLFVISLVLTFQYV
ncbi:hypothetical protein TCAL_00523 [Tigriopus californicus]|uniref:Transferrin-like domain-containing protein n=1 Tax=Tigriopus californicus TaxID=6832 RepID=A0A553PD28_TIGCA|nr:transferrin 2-like [Tigriopus californicus]TRY75589.1 hypothetical protein TCAL_00523 [Tigriopus californicus]|eukprot:TCALIF_00523-PA protein Name:"Similar to MFI2 Melanotransferrin (Homo sapiens)" AED:0.06 eAED:0.06 QI:0/-1/0/1/-1/1/1/0/906